MIVVDSDVLIDALRGRQPSASAVAALLESRALATTSISVFELLSGAKGAREMGKVEALLRPIKVLPVDEDACVAAATARRSLEGSGMTIGMADYLIAGTCISRSLHLLTRNREHFRRVPGLFLSEP